MGKILCPWIRLSSKPETFYLSLKGWWDRDVNIEKGYCTHFSHSKVLACLLIIPILPVVNRTRNEWNHAFSPVTYSNFWTHWSKPFLPILAFVRFSGGLQLLKCSLEKYIPRPWPFLCVFQVRIWPCNYHRVVFWLFSVQTLILT